MSLASSACANVIVVDNQPDRKAPRIRSGGALDRLLHIESANPYRGAESQRSSKNSLRSSSQAARINMAA
jgi:hypothetical protein